MYIYYTSEEIKFAVIISNQRISDLVRLYKFLKYKTTEV